MEGGNRLRLKKEEEEDDDDDDELMEKWKNLYTHIKT